MPFSIFDIQNDEMFEAKALEVFNYQYNNVAVYHEFVANLGINPREVNSLLQIPFLPLEVFKSHTILAKNNTAQTIFKSSGTTGKTTSKHHVTDLKLYEKSFLTNFENTFGNVEDFCILGLLPSYLEKGDSSLVYMMNYLIKKSNHPASDFYLYNTKDLRDVLLQNEKNNQKTILLGVTYALLDFAEEFPMSLSNTIVVETGGMKGRKKEMIREEVQDVLKKSFQLDVVASEYGMTELLSQAWSTNEGVFTTPKWMKILIRDTNDPRNFIKNSKTGAINIIDLANYYSCSFLATADLGRKKENGFEILGRFDNSDVRGCSLLAI